MKMDHWKEPKFRRFLFEFFVLHGIWICIRLLRNGPDRRKACDREIADFRSNALNWLDTFGTPSGEPEKQKEYRENVEFPPIIRND
jgi:hypothetical protein